MNTTHQTLLIRACTQNGAQRQIVDLYQPMICHWIRRLVPAQEVEALTQDVLTTLLEKLPTFKHRGKGSFRSWLRTITRNRVWAFWRDGKHEKAAGGSDCMELLAQLEDPTSDLNRQWDKEHDEHVLRHLLDRAKDVFSTRDMLAFRMLTLGEAPSERVAQELKMTMGAVYQAKSRVLTWLRQEAKGMVD